MVASGKFMYRRMVVEERQAKRKRAVNGQSSVAVGGVGVKELLQELRQPDGTRGESTGR